MPVIIDGYNLLRAIEKLGLTEITDVKMCHVISQYLKSNDEWGVVVFDGIGPRDKSAFHFSHVDVIFSGANIEADTVIEKEICGKFGTKEADSGKFGQADSLCRKKTHCARCQIGCILASDHSVYGNSHQRARPHRAPRKIRRHFRSRDRAVA